MAVSCWVEALAMEHSCSIQAAVVSRREEKGRGVKPSGIGTPATRLSHHLGARPRGGTGRAWDGSCVSLFPHCGCVQLHRPCACKVLQRGQVGVMQMDPGTTPVEEAEGTAER